MSSYKLAVAIAIASGCAELPYFKGTNPYERKRKDSMPENLAKQPNKEIQDKAEQKRLKKLERNKSNQGGMK